MRIQYLFLLAITLFSCSQKPRFELLDTDRTGIDFVNRVEETDSLHVLNFEYIYNGAGVGIADLNNDGLQDVIFTANQIAPAIYLNQGDFKFTDISSAFEDLDNGQWYSGVTFVDINNDGWTDVYLTCTAFEDPEQNRNRFFINQGIQENGELAFTDMAPEYGIDDGSFTVHASFFDYDLDGDLDLYLMNNFVNDRLSATYRPKVVDGSAASNDDLYRNNGDGTFTNVTIQAGIVYEGFGLGLAMGDVNKDGYPDIYISNDYVSNDLLYINQGDGTFRNEIATYMSYQSKSSMGNDMADINNDGYPDMYTMDMFPEYYHKKKQTINGFGYIYFTNDEKFGYEHQFLRNMLHMHNGMANGELIPYSEVGQMLGIYNTEWSWSSLFADYDNDGDKDLIVSNGYPVDMTDKDWTNLKVEVLGSVADEMYVIRMAPPTKAYNHAYENVDDFSFEKKQDGEWFDDLPSYSYGAAFADLDNDGDLDYITNNLNDQAFVYRNQTRERYKDSGNFIKIKLIGDEDNTFAYGAKVELWCEGTCQFQEHFLARGYISSVDPVMHFGLSDHTRVDSIKVTWPATGAVSRRVDLEANQLIEMDATEASLPAQITLPRSTPPFTKKESVLTYDHQQDDFIDFYYSQNILPHKFSQIGPRMALGDLNSDGLEDIITGSTNTLPTTVFIREGETFIETEIEGLSGSRQFSEADFAIIDIDSDGDNDLIGLAGGYEQREEFYRHYLYENHGEAFERRELPLPPFPASVVRPADFDHDGDLDLFIGARVKHMMFPFADDSWILINDDGDFQAGNTMNFNVGMVTDAVWSDYDGDGWEDLLIAREWNSIAVLRNEEGTGFRSQIIPGIDTLHGVWYSVTAADFDNDGDDDYLLGNLGENHRFTVSDRYPLRIYAFDLDMNGTLDPISTGYWKDQHDVMREYPINYLDELAGQSEYFTRRYNDYNSFSYATFEDMMDSTIMSRVNYTFYVNTTSSCILWNGEDGFDSEKLPRRAQVSPIKKTIVDDLNGDGYPDVIIAGNDHTYDIATGYYDANKGLILLSEQDEPLGNLVDPSQSGLVLQGMVESLLYIPGDETYIVAGMNRKNAEVFTFSGWTRQ